MRDYYKGNLVLELSFNFALKIIEYTEILEEKKKYAIARQLLRCGTSIGANIREAQNAESKADFLHKIKIAAKEADETQYWLDLCEESKSYPNPHSLLDPIDQIGRILTKIITSTKRTNKTAH